jgi:DnaJ family protein A protein 3
VLSDDTKRKQFDQFGTAQDFSGAGAPGAGGGSYQGFHSNIDPEELFRNIFGRMGKTAGQSGQFDFGDFDFDNQQHAASAHGFAAAQEVHFIMFLILIDLI